MQKSPSTELSGILQSGEPSVWLLHSPILSREPVQCLKLLARGLSLPCPQAVEMVTLLSTFCVLFSLYLSTLQDAEFYREKEGEYRR